MNTYLKSNYTYCPPLPYLQSKDFVEQSVHFISYITFPLGFYGVYLILWVTPSRMKNIKMVMLFFHLSSMLVDLMVNILITPFIFLPVLSGSFLGLVRYTNIPFKVVTYAGLYSMITMTLSITAMFQQRHSEISTIKFRMTNRITTLIYYAVLYISTGTILLSQFFDDVDVPAVKLDFLQKHPCPPPEFFYEKSGILTTNYRRAGTWLLVIIYIPTLNVLYFVASSIYHLVSVPSKTTSALTKQLQLKFMIKALIQISIPAIALYGPALSVAIATIYSIYKQTFNNLIMIGFSTHGLASNIGLILIYEPYREFTMSMIRKERRKKKTSFVMDSNSTITIVE